jgi:hypothetical protein
MVIFARILFFVCVLRYCVVVFVFSLYFDSPFHVHRIIPETTLENVLKLLIDHHLHRIWVIGGKSTETFKSLLLLLTNSILKTMRSQSASSHLPMCWSFSQATSPARLLSRKSRRTRRRRKIRSECEGSKYI